MLGQSNLELVSSAASWYHLVYMTCFGEHHYAGQLSDISTRNTHAHFMPRAQEYPLKINNLDPRPLPSFLSLGVQTQVDPDA